MTQAEKAEIVSTARPVSLLIKKLNLQSVDVIERRKMLAKHKAFKYKNYDGGLRSSMVYLYEGVYYCNLHIAPLPEQKKK